MWKTLNDVRIADILQFVRDASDAGQAVHIATHTADHVVRWEGKRRAGAVAGWPSNEALVRKTS